jgi:predicted flap endonuclease-1-like 5' DNA nuclease
MVIDISDLRGISERIAAILLEMGVEDSEALVGIAATPQQRRRLAEKIGSSEKEILHLANRADLTRVKGVAGIYADLLEHAGVGSVRSLAKWDPDLLHAEVFRVNRRERLAKRGPALSLVQGWVEHARELPGILME